MASIIFKWFLISSLLFVKPLSVDSNHMMRHPFFVSVTEIEHNPKEKTLEISCKIFIDDFEKALKQLYKTKIDLTDKNYNSAMNKTVNEYLQKHLSVSVNKKKERLEFIGFEPSDGSVMCYFEADDVPVVQLLEVNNSILYDYKTEQVNIVHVKVNGNRKSNKLSNPDEKLVFEF